MDHAIVAARNRDLHPIFSSCQFLVTVGIERPHQIRHFLLRKCVPFLFSPSSFFHSHVLSNSLSKKFSSTPLSFFFLEGPFSSEPRGLLRSSFRGQKGPFAPSLSPLPICRLKQKERRRAFNFVETTHCCITSN